MKAIHVNWTKPYFHKHRLRGHGFEVIKNLKSKTYDVPDSQILFTLLSIVNWKKYNGPEFNSALYVSEDYDKLSILIEKGLKC